STHAASSCEAALGFAGLPRPSYDRSLWALRTPGPASVTLSWDGSPGLRSPAHAVRREGLAGDVLHDWDGALADQRDRHRLGANAPAGGRPRHDHAVAAEEDEIAQQIGAEEAARLLLEDDDVVGLWRDLVDDLVAVAPGVPDEGLFLRAVVLPGPAAGVPVVGPAHPGGVDDGYPLGVGDVDQPPDARHAVPGLGAARVAPALDRLQNRLPAVAAEAVVHVDDEQGRPLAEPRPGAVSGRGEHRLVTLGQELIPDGL